MEALIARGIQILLALGGAYMLTLWFALIVWTFQDIQARSRSVVAQIFSTLTVVLFFIPGVLLYMILRPKETLDDAFQRSLQEEYLMQDLEELPLCPSCQQYVEEDWVFCPSCHTELRDHCVSCGHLVDLRWSLCPFCGAEQYPEEQVVAIEREGERPAVGPGTRSFAGRPRRELPGQRIAALKNGIASLPIEQSTVRIDFRTNETATEGVSRVRKETREFTTIDGTRQVTFDGTRPATADGQSGDPVHQDGQRSGMQGSPEAAGAAGADPGASIDKPARKPAAPTEDEPGDAATRLDGAENYGDLRTATGGKHATRETTVHVPGDGREAYIDDDPDDDATRSSR
jgi:RNA polymerase subunit RPABC4/transcription elongation factor Spt4